MKFNCEQKAVVVVKHQQVLPTLRFSHEFGIVFCGVAVFLKTCGVLGFRLVFLQNSVL